MFLILASPQGQAPGSGEEAPLHQPSRSSNVVERLASRVGHQQGDGQEDRIAALKAAAEVEGSYVRTCKDVENGEKQRQDLNNSLNPGQRFVTAQQLQQQLGAQQHLQQLAIQQQQFNRQLGAQEQLQQLANQQQHHFQHSAAGVNILY